MVQLYPLSFILKVLLLPVVSLEVELGFKLSVYLAKYIHIQGQLFLLKVKPGIYQKGKNQGKKNRKKLVCIKTGFRGFPGR